MVKNSAAGSTRLASLKALSEGAIAGEEYIIHEGTDA